MELRRPEAGGRVAVVKVLGACLVSSEGIVVVDGSQCRIIRLWILLLMGVS